MSPGEILALCAALVVFAIILPIVFRRKKTDMYEDVARSVHRSTMLDNDSVDPGAAPPQRYPAASRGFGKREVSPERTHLRGAIARINITPRQLERINTQRLLRGKPALNRRGLENAIAHPWDRADVRQPSTSSDWLSYLIAYEVFFADHSAPTSPGFDRGITIDPTAPYNGQGGEFAGGGASGDWSNSITRSEATAIAIGAPIEPARSLGEGVGPYQAAGTPGSNWNADPAPAPSYSAPDPTPSYSGSSDSGSYSSGGDSGGSSGGDSGGSSGGGGDSGGG